MRDMNTFSVEHPRLSDDRRTIVISDIHGNCTYLRGLIDKLHLRRDDQLILLGDLVDRGHENLATLRYILSLRDRCHLYGVVGNHDFWHLWVDEDAARWFDEAGDAHTVAMLLKKHAAGQGSLIMEMCAALGLSLTEDTDLGSLKAALREGFGAEFELLRSLPYALDTESCTFVHAGIPQGETLESAGMWRCIKLDYFYRQRPHFRKWTVVGHTPVCLYGSGTASAMPILDRACRLASIDGGCVLKNDGQLNALILRRGKMSTEWYDPYPLARARTVQRRGERSAYIRWGDNEVVPVELGRSWCRVRHERTGYEMDVPTDMLYESAGVLRVDDISDYRPFVDIGDTLSIVRETDRGYMIKKDGVSGWYSGEIDYI